MLVSLHVRAANYSKVRCYQNYVSTRSSPLLLHYDKFSLWEFFPKVRIVRSQLLPFDYNISPNTSLRQKCFNECCTKMARDNDMHKCMFILTFVFPQKSLYSFNNCWFRNISAGQKHICTQVGRWIWVLLCILILYKQDQLKLTKTERVNINSKRSPSTQTSKQSLEAVGLYFYRMLYKVSKFWVNFNYNVFTKLDSQLYVLSSHSWHAINLLSWYSLSTSLRRFFSRAKASWLPQTSSALKVTH